MKTNRASGFARVFAGFTVLAVFAACSGNQAETTYGADGAVLGDGSFSSHPDSGTHPGSGTGTATFDSGIIGTPDTGAVTTPDTGTATHDTGTVGTGDASTGGTCPSTCTTDSECATGCPATAGAVNCCDTVTSACFMSAASVCPDQMPSGGGTDSGAMGS